MLAPLALSAHLVISLEDNDFLVHATEDNIVVDLPSWRAGLAIMRFQPARGERSQLLMRIQRGLTVADLQMQFRLAGKVIARLSPDTRPGIVSRLLSCGPLELQPLQLLLSVWNRSP